MRISILTPDSKMPNLAAMKISAFHKAQGDEVTLNMPLWPADFTYASVLFEWTRAPNADLIGGPGFNPGFHLPAKVDALKPDYTLYPDMDYSIGYTYRACHRGCTFCKVPQMEEPTDHRSIWTFHEKRFKKIALMNNNTFEDPRWLETFEEIWAAGLIIKDMGGYDARLIDQERAEALARTKFEGQLHFAWDQMKDEAAVLKGIGMVIAAGVRPVMVSCYILVGYDTTEEEDIYRIRMLRRLGVLPFAMPYDLQKLKKVKPYVLRFLRKVTRPAIVKNIDWEKVNNWKEAIVA